MPNHEFENYLALVSRMMRLNRPQKEMIRHELRDHLETRIAELVESGTEPDEAVRRALEEFGDAAVLAQRFQTVFQVTQRRWMMRFATFSIAGTFLVAVLVMAMWPAPARFGAPSSSIAQDPFTADEGVEGSEDPFGNDGTATENPFGSDSNAVSTATSKPIRKPVRRIMTSDDIDKKLQMPSDFDYVDVQFIEIMEELSERYGFNVLLDYSARDDSLTEDELITFRIRNARLSTALRLMLQDKNATYIVQDGILRIISLDVAEDPEYHRRKIFDCRQLLARIRVAEKDRIGTPISVQKLQPGGFGGQGGHGGGVFNYPSTLQLGGGEFGGGGAGGFGGGHDDSEKEMLTTGVVSQIVTAQDLEAEGSGANREISDPEAGEESNSNANMKAQADHQFLIKRVTAEGILINLVKKSVDPDSWENTNGDATLMVVAGFMIVTHSQQALDQVDNLIGELEQRLRQK